MGKQINSPALYTVVEHAGWKQDEDIYPCEVLITKGCYLDDIYGRISNFWHWKRVLADGSLAEEEHGYGDFKELDKDYELEIKVNFK